MSSYTVQFQRGLSLVEFTARYGTEALCVDALERPARARRLSLPVLLDA